LLRRSDLWTLTRADSAVRQRCSVPVDQTLKSRRQAARLGDGRRTPPSDPALRPRKPRAI
jgi:hypothetical protein